MATSGKKQKKNKWKAVDPTLIINTSALPIKPVSWAEAAEEDEREQLFAASKPAQKIVLPSAPRASIDAEVYERTVPHEGPFMAFLQNLSFDIAEEDIYEFFQELRVARVDLPRDDRSGGRCKGFAHVEFETRDSLIEALGFIDASIKGRRVRIDLPNAQDDRQNRGGQNERRQYNRDRNNQDRDRANEDPERTSGDWRSAPRAEVEERRRPYGGRDSYNRDSDRRSPRRGGFRGSDENAVMTRDDFGTAKPTPLPERERGPRGEGRGGGFTDRGRDRDSGRAFDRSEMKDPSQRGVEGSSPERYTARDREPRDGGRTFDRSEMKDPSARGAEGSSQDRFSRADRDRDGGRTFDRTEMREPPKDLSPPSEPKTRPKLNLAPRTKPIETPPPLPQPPLDDENPSAPPNRDEDSRPPVGPGQKPSAASIFGAAKPVDTAARNASYGAAREEDPRPPAPKPSAASIFGGAKPVDTAARERQIEEKLKSQDALPRPRGADSEDDGPPRSRGTSPHPHSVNSKDAPPPPPENAWTKRSQQLTSNITNGTSPDSGGDDSPHTAAPQDPAPGDSEPLENDENKQPNSLPAGPEPRAPADDFELAKDRSTRRRENALRDGGPKEGGRDIVRGGERGPPPRDGPRRFDGPPRDRDTRGFRNNDDRSKRPFTRDNNRPPRDRDSQPPRRNFDSDRPPRNREEREDVRDFRRNPNNNSNNESRFPAARRDNNQTRRGDDGGEDMRRGGGNRPASSQGPPASAPGTAPPSGAPPGSEPAPKPKKKTKDPIDDIAKMPKVQETKMPNFAQGNKFSLLPDEEGEDVDVDI
ncbi:hypothetical protein M8J75_005378 [Diaphorina citri]|nr:hypothetical protein M8J75_005378 [Diaphorina citri]